jgi:hypothetical protein
MFIRPAAVISARCCLADHSSCIAESCDCYCHSALAGMTNQWEWETRSQPSTAAGERHRRCSVETRIFILLMLLALAESA